MLRKQTVKLTLSCGHSTFWHHEVEAPFCSYCKGIRKVVKVEPITHSMLTGIREPEDLMIEE